MRVSLSTEERSVDSAVNTIINRITFIKALYQLHTLCAVSFGEDFAVIDIARNAVRRETLYSFNFIQDQIYYRAKTIPPHVYE